MGLKRKTSIKLLEEIQTPLAFRFTRLAKRYYGAADKSFRELDMERNFLALSIVGSHPFVTQQCLSDCMDVDKASIVRAIDYLTEKGLVKREVNPGDRREHIIVATPKARKIIPRIKDVFASMNKSAFKGFSREEKESFVNMTLRMMENLSAMNSGKNYEVKYIRKKKEND